MRSRMSKTVNPRPQLIAVEAMKEKLLWDIDDAADRLSVGVSTIYRLLKDKKLAKTRVVGCTRISEEELRRFIRENTESSAA